MKEAYSKVCSSKEEDWPIFSIGSNGTSYIDKNKTPIPTTSHTYITSPPLSPNTIPTSTPHSNNQPYPAHTTPSVESPPPPPPRSLSPLPPTTHSHSTTHQQPFIHTPSSLPPPLSPKSPSILIPTNPPRQQTRVLIPIQSYLL